MFRSNNGGNALRTRFVGKNNKKYVCMFFAVGPCGMGESVRCMVYCTYGVCFVRKVLFWVCLLLPYHRAVLNCLAVWAQGVLFFGVSVTIISSCSTDSYDVRRVLFSECVCYNTRAVLSRINIKSTYGRVRSRFRLRCDCSWTVELNRSVRRACSGVSMQFSHNFILKNV